MQEKHETYCMTQQIQREHMSHSQMSLLWSLDSVGHIPKPERCVAQRKGLFREPASASHYSEDRVSVLHALLSYKLSTFCEM